LTSGAREFIIIRNDSPLGVRRYCGAPMIALLLRVAPALKCESPARWLI
jgi:hypothetical protein